MTEYLLACLALMIGAVIILLLLHTRPKTASHHALKPHAVVVFTLTADAGFASMFFMQLKAYMWAAAHDYSFYTAHDNWQYTYASGWHDYFASLETLDATNPRHEPKIHFRHGQDELAFVPPYSIQQYRDAVGRLFVVQGFIEAAVEKYMREKLQTAFVSLYVRRGDKDAEREHMTLRDILTYVNLGPPDMPLFLQTDDYTVYEELCQLYPTRQIETLTDPSQRGSRNSDLTHWPPEKRKTEFELFLVSCLIFLRASRGYADATSNVGRLLKLLAFDSISLYPLSYESEQALLDPKTRIEPVFDFEPVP